ncbi:hypothetical protein Hanom_Chr02g00148341 [Helianthus anomalus]
MPSSYPGRHMSLPRLEPSTSGKRWVSVANWATPVGYPKPNNKSKKTFLWKSNSKPNGPLSI